MKKPAIGRQKRFRCLLYHGLAHGVLRTLLLDLGDGAPGKDQMDLVGTDLDRKSVV